MDSGSDSDPAISDPILYEEDADTVQENETDNGTEDTLIEAELPDEEPEETEHPDEEPEPVIEAADEPGEPEEAPVEEEAEPFEDSVSVNGTVITVTADAGVFPAGSVLSVTEVPAEVEAYTDAAIEGQNDACMIAASYTFDIKVLGPDGNEVQPAEGDRVQVRFSLAELSDANVEASVYHIEESDLQNPEELAAEVDLQEHTISAETEGFSIYKVVFTYETRQYPVYLNQTIPVNEVLTGVNLNGTAEQVTVSSEDLLSAYVENGEWILKILTEFSEADQPYIEVTIGSFTYTISLKMDTSIASWALLNELLSGSESGSVIELTEDLTAGPSDTALVIPEGKDITLDLKGHTLNRGLKAPANDGCVLLVHGSLTLKNGTITGGNNIFNGGGIESDGTLVLEDVIEQLFHQRRRYRQPGTAFHYRRRCYRQHRRIFGRHRHL